MKSNKFYFFLFGVMLHLFISYQSFALLKINAIEFGLYEGEPRLFVQSNDDIEFEKILNESEKQVLIEIKNASLGSKELTKKVDTSAFKTAIMNFSVYEVQAQNLVKILIQLNENKVNLDAIKTKNGYYFYIQKVEIKSDLNPSFKTDKIKIVQSATEGESGEAKLVEYTQNTENKVYTGKALTLQVRDADLEDVFRLISEASGFNIVMNDDVKGKVTLSLVDVPWDLALDTILQSQKLGAERIGNVLRVAGIQSLASEKVELMQAKRASQAATPKMTKIFPISFARLTEMQSLLMQFAQTELNANKHSDKLMPLVTTVIALDERTNSLVIQDTPENLERIKKMIELLDVQAPQVMIEAKVIEASESFSRALGGSFGIGGEGARSWLASFSGGNPRDGLYGDPGVFKDGAAVASSTGGGGTIGFSPSFSVLPGISRLNALLAIGESESQVKVVSAPKTVVINKETANIFQGTPVLVKTIQSTQTGNLTLEQVQTANLGLKVTPSVTQEGSVFLDLSVSRDTTYEMVGGSTGIAPRNMQTKVVVDSGTTLVIGGIYSMQNISVGSGIPWLRKIPLLGWFFGSEKQKTERSELFIFVTPRVLNEKDLSIGT